MVWFFKNKGLQPVQLTLLPLWAVYFSDSPCSGSSPESGFPLKRKAELLRVSENCTVSKKLGAALPTEALTPLLRQVLVSPQFTVLLVTESGRQGHR